MDCSLPGSCVHGIFQARVLEWVAISFASAWKWKVKVKSLSRVRLHATPWTVAQQAPPSMGFFQPRVLEWGAIAFSSGSNHPQPVKKEVSFILYGIHCFGWSQSCGFLFLKYYFHLFLGLHRILVVTCGPSFLTRNWTQAPCIGSTGS